METEKIIEIMQHFKEVMNINEKTERKSVYFPETALICCGRFIENKDKICPICKNSALVSQPPITRT